MEIIGVFFQTQTAPTCIFPPFNHPNINLTFFSSFACFHALFDRPIVCPINSFIKGWKISQPCLLSLQKQSADNRWMELQRADNSLLTSTSLLTKPSKTILSRQKVCWGDEIEGDSVHFAPTAAAGIPRTFFVSHKETWRTVFTELHPVFEVCRHQRLSQRLSQNYYGITLND